MTQDVYEKHLANMERIMALALRGHVGWDRSSATATNGWDAVADKMGWQLFEHKPRDRPTSFEMHEYLAVGSLKTSIAALQEAFYVKNTHDLRALSGVLYEDTLLDAALLNLTHRRTPEDPGQFFGVKYLKLSVQVANQEDVDQEYIYLEFAGTRLDAQGRVTYVIITDPVSVRAPEHRQSSLTFGERCSTVKLYRESSNGTVDVVVRAKLQSSRGLPMASRSQSQIAGHFGVNNAAQQCKAAHLVYWKAMGVFLPGGLVKDLMSLPKETSAPEARRLATGPFSTNWNHASKSCIVCSKGFNLLRRKHHCRRCGEAVCKGCTVSLYCVDRPTKLTSSSALAKEKFCKTCFVAAKIDANRPTPPKPERSTTQTTHTIVLDHDDASSGSDSLPYRDIVHVHSPGRDERGKLFFYADTSSSQSESRPNSLHSDPQRTSFHSMVLHDGSAPPPLQRSGSIESNASVSSSVFDMMNAVRMPRGRPPVLNTLPRADAAANKDNIDDDDADSGNQGHTVLRHLY
ncbi:hypothetical protein SPRG_19832 [Saprolegnia parasitica CBS 223.65]|uniref:FYVE-type domain-containing protein n=1 Tax=Saprolegnia parasitica (strain CBS 223.65) TaxID=695850 RepID=A0A067CIF6_SAPPC|nr:hypothetical protein SPRG_19832 [Saprolegnia parasitica CBS 223.65]KDO30283.1 hypothetical protein SPRG_19832 [Saprolegnia parasitica CBS 223.65]|eukprot:XP_012199080.1 hypothetical protein SPRG_19832 [Saprolegnia parasitica CBS 223.65]